MLCYNSIYLEFQIIVLCHRILRRKLKILLERIMVEIVGCINYLTLVKYEEAIGFVKA